MTSTTNPPPVSSGPLDPKIIATLTWVLTMLAGVAVGKGWLTKQEANGLINGVILAIGPVAGLVLLIWQIWRNQHAKILQRVADLPGVEKIEASRLLVMDANHPKVVPVPAPSK